jgi:hypothetical protein
MSEVLHSGHTFHEAGTATLNYLLFPPLGDGAVFQAGFLDEAWQFPRPR